MSRLGGSLRLRFDQWDREARGKDVDPLCSSNSEAKKTPRFSAAFPRDPRERTPGPFGERDRFTAGRGSRRAGSAARAHRPRAAIRVATALARRSESRWLYAYEPVVSV